MSFRKGIPCVGAYARPSRRCPSCGAAAHRIRRHMVDRLVSAIVLQHRYRCGAIGCTWEGRLPANTGNQLLFVRKRTDHDDDGKMAAVGQHRLGDA